MSGKNTTSRCVAELPIYEDDDFILAHCLDSPASAGLGLLDEHDNSLSNPSSCFSSPIKGVLELPDFDLGWGNFTADPQDGEDFIQQPLDA